MIVGLREAKWNAIQYPGANSTLRLTYGKVCVLPINFLTDNDNTGGNSGSSVLSGKGESIGVDFYGNIETMTRNVILIQNCKEQ